MLTQSAQKPHIRQVGRWVLLLLGLLYLSGCAFFYRAPVKPPLGIIYTQVKAPLTYQFDGSPTGLEKTSKVSKKSTQFLYVPFIPWIWCFGWDDASIAKIAREGGLREVSYADYDFLSVLGIYAAFTVEVYGS